MHECDVVSHVLRVLLDKEGLASRIAYNPLQDHSDSRVWLAHVEPNSLGQYVGLSADCTF